MSTNTVLRTHTAVVTHIYAYYTTTVNRARMHMSPNKNYSWYINHSNSSIVSVHIYVLTMDTADHEQVW